MFIAKNIPVKKSYVDDYKYCVICGEECLQDERRALTMRGKKLYVCDCCYGETKREREVIE